MGQHLQKQDVPISVSGHSPTLCLLYAQIPANFAGHTVDTEDSPKAQQASWEVTAPEALLAETVG